MKRLFNKMFHGSGVCSFLPLVMLIVCSILGTTDAWGKKNYSSSCTATAAPTGKGSVYVNYNSDAKGSTNTAKKENDSQSSAPTHKYYLYAVSTTDGYYFTNWSNVQNGLLTDGHDTKASGALVSVTAGTSEKKATVTGNFAPVAISLYDGQAASENIDAQYAKHTYTGSVSFGTTGADAQADFVAPAFEDKVGNGVYTMTSWSYANNKVIVNYSFTGNSAAGVTTANLVLRSAGRENSSKVAFSATSVAPTITSGNAGAQLTPSTPTALAEGTATFNVTNAEDASYFATPTFTNVQGGGTWKVVSTSYAAGVYTVNYTFQSDASHLGDHSADLILTATVGSATKTVTATAFTEVEADYDVEVFNKSGVSIHQGDWATAVTKANANEGSTIKLCRNVDLGVLSTHGANITVNTTLDLAGKTLSATCNTKDRYTIYLTKAKTLTITDSKNGGTIRTTGSYNGVIYCVGASAGSIIMNGGTISHENTMTYASGSSVQTRAVQIAANANFTLNDGEIIAEGGNNVFGIRKEGSTTATGEVHINGGTINANCKRQYAYAVYTLGKLFVDGGTINAKTYTSSGTSEAYGIYVSASANQTDASEYGGHLSISESSTVVINAQSQTSGAYAISVAGAYTCAKVDGAYTHTTARAYPASAEIHAGTFNAYSTTSGAYGLRVICSVKSVDETLSETVVKPTIVYGGTFNATAHTSSAFGIRADAVTSWAYGALERSVVEIYDANATAIAETGTDAYGAYVASAAGDYAMLHTENGDPGTKGGSYSSGYLDGGCYVVASKMTIHGGTFTGIAQTKTTAYGVCCQTRAIAADAIYDEEKGDYDKVAYPELIIEGGTFVGQTETSTSAGGLYTGGHTTVTGGSFSALPKTTTAYGVFVNAGTANISNATITATATSSAYGVYVNAGVAGTTGFCTFGEATLNNLSVTATTTTGNEADGVRIVTAQNTIPEAAKWNCHPGEYVCAGKATINGGTYNVTAAGTTAYGVCLNSSAPTILGNKVATGEAHMKDASFVVKTKGTTTAYGVHAGGLTSIDNCTFDVAAQTTTAYGIYAQDKECSVKNSTFTVNAGGNTAYGIYANASLSGYMRIPLESRVVSSNNKFTVVSGGTPAYGVYAHSAKMVQNATTWAALSDANKTTYPYPEKYAYGEWAVAGEVSLEDNEIDVTAVGATARTIYTRGNCKPTETSEVSAMAKVTIDGGKYKATAVTTQQEVFNETPKASDGYYPPEGEEPILIKGGFFKNEANLDFYKAPGLYVNKLKSGEDAEYAEGYRFEVGAPRFGTPVCKNGSKEYLTLEAALEDVNNGTVNGGTIVMTLPYTLPAGNYKIPSNTTLLVPYKSGTGKGANQAIGKSAQTTNPSSITAVQTPSCYLLLTLASGAHIDVYGTVEASAQQFDYTTSSGTSIVYGPYGQIHMEEGSSMSLESGAYLQAWGYVTGKGETTARRGSTVIENFQVFDWKGGTVLSNSGFMKGSTSNKVFPINQYFIQSVESPVIYRPGSHLTSSFHTSVAVLGTQGADDVGVVGEWRSNSDKDVALFLMDAADMSDDTWVRKEYDAVNDIQLYTINSSAMLSAMKVNTGTAGTVNSADYDLPLGSNFKIVVNSGKLQITQDVQMFAGAEIEVYKEGDLQINSGCKVYLWDKDEWGKFAYSGKYVKTVSYCPSWKTSPRYAMQDSKVMLSDATINIHGSMTIIGNLYTTNGGANIISNNTDAGKIIFQNTTAAANSTVYQVSTYSNNTAQFDAYTVTPAQLTNENGTFTSTVGASNGKTYCYSEGRWQCWEQVGCYQVDKSDDANWKWYANPSDFVQVKSNETDNHVAPVMDEDHLYPSADETRFFILMDGCMWWEVSLVDNNLCYSEMNDTYYQWDGSKWIIKSFVITWKDWNGTTLDTYNNVKYRSMPKWLSATPTKTKQTGDPAGSYYIFSGWTPDLDIVTENTTYTATYELIVPKYDVLWKSEDGNKTLHISRWAEGEHPAYDGAEIKKATSMEGVDLAHNGWSTAANGAGTRYGLTDELPAMGTTAQTYYATFAEGSIISWFDENGNLLDKKLWAAGTRPTHANINKESDAQYDYVFAGWTPEVLPVEADAEYTAVFTPVLRQYAITFSNLNGKGSSQVVNVNYGATPVCPVTPDRGNSAEYSYEWTGWKDGAGNTFGTDYVFPAVSGDATYTATFSQTTRTYTVTWKNEDGSVLERVRGLAFGDAVPDFSKATPEKEPTRYLVYGFAGWTPAKKATIDESGDQEYRATYDAGSTRYYTVRWLKDNGELIDESHLEYDQMPTHADPTKASTALYSYDFAGWTPAISAVKGDAEYKATFNAIHRQYEITYILYDDVKNVVRYEAEDAVTAPAVPTREGYTFVGWDKEIPATMPAEDVTIRASWTANQYTITFNSNGGTSIDPINGNYGDPISAPADPTREGYTFAGWDAEIPSTMPVGGMTINATWTINQYDITWKNEDGTTLTTTKVNYNVLPTYTGATPTKAATAQYSYTFNGWDPAIVVATEDATYTATFASTTNKYTITFANIDGNGGMSEVEYEYGATPSYAGTPAKEEDATNTYEFTRWDKEFATVTEATTYTAQFTAHEKTLTATTITVQGNEVHVGGNSQGTTTYEITAPTAVIDSITLVSDSETPTSVTLKGTEASISRTIEISGENMSLVLDNGASITTPELILGNGGTVEVINGSVTTTDLVIRSVSGSNITSTDVPDDQFGTSGRVNSNSKIKVTGDAYFELELTCWSEHDDDPSYNWHAFSVPFPVDLTEVGAVQGDNHWSLTPGYTNLVFGKNYSIATYDGAKRARGQLAAWTTIDKNSVLQPGVFYFMTVDGWSKKMRFKKVKDADLYASNAMTVNKYEATDGNTNNAGWNGLGNSTLDYASANGVSVVTILDPVSYSYTTVDASSISLATGAAFFVQADQNGAIEQTVSVGQPSASVAARVTSSTDMVRVALKMSSATYRDNLFLTASSDASVSYEAGRDLEKMKMSATPNYPMVAANAYGLELSAMYTPWVNGEAIFPLSLYAPEDGLYTIAIRPTDEDVYLLQNGYPIANLSYGNYSLYLDQGNSYEYSIGISRRRVATDLDENEGADDHVNVQKIYWNKHIYILRDGQMYDATGKLVK